MESNIVHYSMFTLTILFWALNLFAMLIWAKLWIILLEVVVCKDARRLNAERILKKKFSIRFRLLKRSFRTPFYSASVMLFFGTIIVLFLRIEETWSGIFPPIGFRPLGSFLIAYALVILYKHMGYGSTFLLQLKTDMQEFFS